MFYKPKIKVMIIKILMIYKINLNLNLQFLKSIKLDLKPLIKINLNKYHIKPDQLHVSNFLLIKLKLISMS